MNRSSSAVERWRRIVRRQRDSGLGVAEFCRRRGLAASTLFAWRRRLGREAEAGATPAFVAVRPAADAPATEPSTDQAPPIELHLGRGWRLVLRGGFDAQALREVLAALEGRP